MILAGIVITPSFTTRPENDASRAISRFVAVTEHRLPFASRRILFRIGSVTFFPVNRSAWVTTFLRLSRVQRIFIKFSAVLRTVVVYILYYYSITIISKRFSGD